MRWIALLRGINVGGARKVPMAQLRALLADLGYADVRTHLQSGNAVFTAGDDRYRLRAEIERAIAAAFGFEVLVMLRSRDELAAVVADHPLRDVVTATNRFHVLFLAEPADPARLAAIDVDAHAPEQFVLRGRELYLWTPEGIGRSRLAQALDERRLGTAATARNWRTVEALLALADAAA